MPASKITFNGINRAVSDFSNAGSCEELINLRPTDTGLNPAKDFQVMMRNIPWRNIWVHKVGPYTKYVAMKVVDNGTGKEISFWQIDENGEVIGSALGEPFTVDWEFDDNSVHFAAMGNMFTISIADSATSIYRNLSFIWKDGSYSEISAELEHLTEVMDSATLTQGDITIYTTSVSLTQDPTNMELVSAMNDGFNILEAENPTVAFGRFLVALCLRTTDGKEFWTAKWMGNNMDQAIKGTDGDPNYTVVIGSTTTYWYNADDNGKITGLVGPGNDGTAIAALAGCTYSVTIPRIVEYTEGTSMLSEVCVYASRPERYIDTQDPNTVSTYGAGNLGHLFLLRTDADYHPEDQLLYLQERIPIKTLLSGSKTVELRFGGVTQTTGKTLEADAGMVRRYGDMLSYNSRLHYYGSTSETFLSRPTFVTYGALGVSPHVYITYLRIKKADGSSILVQNTRMTSLRFSPMIVIYPDARVTNVYVRRTDNDQVWEADMTPSNRYNFSYAKSFSLVSDATLLAELDAAQTLTSFLSDEPQDLNVTEQYNPFVFDVSHSYRAPGAILDVQPQMVSVPDVTYGDYPLNVFTSNGVFALTQGNGEVLYARFVPVSGLVSESNCAVTDEGTFFIAAGGIWLIAGRRTILVSDALHEGPHKYIRSAVGYQALSHNEEIYNVQPYESQVPFDEFLKGAVLSFNRYRAEIIVSSPYYNYSYVLSLKYRQWFKIAHRFTQSTVGGDIIIGLVGIDTASSDYCVLNCANAMPDDPDDNTARTVTLSVTDDNGGTFSVSVDFIPEASGGEEYVPVTGVSLNKSTASVTAGTNLTLSATVTPSNATNRAVTWSTSNASVATVSTAGLVRGVTPGTATITVTTVDGGYTATCAVTVVAAVTYPHFEQSSYTILKGESESFNVLNPEGMPVCFRVSSALYAKTTAGREVLTSTYDSDGNTGTRIPISVTNTRMEGTYTISAKAIGGTLYDTCTINIVTEEDYIPVTSVSLNKSEITLAGPGATETLIATVEPDYATDTSVSWSSTADSVASVDEDGEVTAVAQGTTTITATSNDDPSKSASCIVTVVGSSYVPVESLSISPVSATAPAGRLIYFDFTILPANATNKGVKCSTNASISDSSVAIVYTGGDDRVGVLTQNPGTTTLTAFAKDNESITATATITVVADTVPVTGVTLDRSALAMNTGDTVKLTATVEPSNADDKTVSWSSDDTSVATVSSNGTVTAVGAGTATITVTTTDGSYTATCDVTVTEPVEGDAVEVSPLSLSFAAAGEVKNVTITTTGTWTAE